MKYTFPASVAASASASAIVSAVATAGDESRRELEQVHILLEERLPIQDESQSTEGPNESTNEAQGE